MIGDLLLERRKRKTIAAAADHRRRGCDSCIAGPAAATGQERDVPLVFIDQWKKLAIFARRRPRAGALRQPWLIRSRLNA